MKNKPAKKIFESTKFQIKKCDEKGCNEEGSFIAPKSPNSNEKYFFCLKHIKIYQGMYQDCHTILELKQILMM